MPRSSCSLFSISASLAATNIPRISVDSPISDVLYNWYRTMSNLFCQFLLTLYFHDSFILKQIFVVCFMAKWYLFIFYLKYLKILFILCVNVFCLHACLCTVCMIGAQECQKRVWDPQELELQMLVSLHVGVGNQTLVLWKNEQLLTTKSSLQLFCFYYYCKQFLE